MSKSYRCQLDTTYVTTIPDELLKELHWNKYTPLEISLEGKNIIIKEKTEWTEDEIQEGENLEMILEDVSHNNTVHYITTKTKGKFVLIPISELDHLKID